MSTPKKWSRALLVAGGALVVVAAAAVIKRDAIAGLILKGGDVSLMEEEAKASPQAQLAVGFLAALPTVRLALTIGLLALGYDGALAQSTSVAVVAYDSTALATVRAYFAAYNDHDVDRVVRLLSPDFVWLSVAGDSVTVEARGAAAIRSSLLDYFRRLPSARSDIEAAAALGPWVSVRERARWQGSSGPRSQAAMSVYEVRDGVLRRVWYYPEVKESSSPATRDPDH